MRNLKKNLLIGLFVALASEFYLNVFVSNFRISPSVILFPILIMTLGQELRIMDMSASAAGWIFCFRFLIRLFGGTAPAEAAIVVIPATIFYLSYGALFHLFIRNRHTANPARTALTAFGADFLSNCLEMTLQDLLQRQPLDVLVTANFLLGIALIRAACVFFTLFCIMQYEAFLRNREHEERYQRLYLLKSGLQSELYLMRKNTEEIERVMGNAYRMYESVLEADLPEELRNRSLAIARDVHEIKKDYLRVIQGIEQEIETDYDLGSMRLSDILRVLKESSYRAIDARKLKIRIIIEMDFDMPVEEHYALMSVFKNLVNNAIEAIESDSGRGTIVIGGRREEGICVFTVSDNGPGIREKNLERIFQMGYSTKFDEKTGNMFRGVGLCGVRQMIGERFGGTIAVESEYGNGTTFTVRIPEYAIAGKNADSRTAQNVKEQNPKEQNPKEQSGKEAGSNE